MVKVYVFSLVTLTHSVSITLGILISYWLEYGTHYIGGTRCAPNIPYTGGTAQAPTFNPYKDVGPDGCTGQSDASWRVPFALQIAPALVLGIGMIFFPESPRFLLMKGREDAAINSLSRLRRVPSENAELRGEFLAIKAEVVFQEKFNQDRFGAKSGLALSFAQYVALVSRPSDFRRLAIGCCTMFFQQFMGCNASESILSSSVCHTMALANC